MHETRTIPTAEARRRLISDGYLELQQQLHREVKEYGVSGHSYAELVSAVAEGLGVVDLLDYGAGKETLAAASPQYAVHSYDPCIDHIAGEPAPHDLVVCTDVLEHVEEERVDAVLDHIAALTRKVVCLQVSLIPSLKTLADGRNAHICLKPKEWWLTKLMERWSLDSLQTVGRGFIAVCSVREPPQ